jgi:hypothetical protein
MSGANASPMDLLASRARTARHSDSDKLRI